jgi:hypothetical protein
MHVKHNIPYHTCIYSHIPEGKLFGLKHLEYIRIKTYYTDVENVHFVGLCCIIGRGARQVWCLSPIPFNFCNEYGIRKAVEGFEVFKIG